MYMFLNLILIIILEWSITFYINERKWMMISFSVLFSGEFVILIVYEEAIYLIVIIYISSLVLKLFTKYSKIHNIFFFLFVYWLL